MSIRASRIPAVAVSLLLISACGGLLTSEQPPRQVYLLQPLSTTAAGEAGQRQLQFGLEVVPGLDGDRILGLQPDARLIPYANARWPDHLPEVLHSVIRRSLEAGGRFAPILPRGVPQDAATDGWTLELEVRAFYGIVDAAGGTRSVRADLAGRIGCGGKTFGLELSESAMVAGERLAAVVAAHQSVLDSVTRALIADLDSKRNTHCRNNGS